jgi:hypothetical protein
MYLWAIAPSRLRQKSPVRRSAPPTVAGYKRRHHRPDRGYLCDQFGGASGRLDADGEIGQVVLATARMQIEAALREILAIPPAMVTKGTGCWRNYLIMPPTKSPMSIRA